MGNEARKVRNPLGSFSFWTSKLAATSGDRNGGAGTQEPLSRELRCAEEHSYLCDLQSQSLGASREGFKLGYFTSQLPQGSRAGLPQRPTLPPPAFGTLVSAGHSHPCPWDVIPRGVSARLSGSVGLSAFLPPQEALSQHRPALLRPRFLLHPARFTLLFPPSLPLPHGCQAMFAFLSPAVFPLPAPPPRSLPAPSSPRGDVPSQS